MTPLLLLLSVKIAVTVAFVAGPFLLLSKRAIEERLTISASNSGLFRLYGVAMLALVTAYSGGKWQITQGVFPIPIVLMGIVSNIGATIALLCTGFWKSSKLLTAFFAMIGLSLILGLILPEFAMMKLYEN